MVRHAHDSVAITQEVLTGFGVLSLRLWVRGFRNAISDVSRTPLTAVNVVTHGLVIFGNEISRTLEDHHENSEADDRSDDREYAEYSPSFGLHMRLPSSPRLQGSFWLENVGGLRTIPLNFLRDSVPQ